MYANMTRPQARRTWRTPMPRSRAEIWDVAPKPLARASTMAGACRLMISFCRWAGVLTHANGAVLSRRGTKRCLRDGAYRPFSTLYNDLIYPKYLDCCDRLGSRGRCSEGQSF